MFRSFLRFTAYLILAAGVIIAVVDATRMLTVPGAPWTDLRPLVALLAPDWAGLAADRESVTGMILSTPLAALAGALFVLIYGFAARTARKTF
jgi:ABC-type uncharacterized transport system permease subunit